MKKACCFSGHRNIPEKDIQKIRQRVRESIGHFVHNGGTYFACGGAMGFDMLAAEEVIRSKEIYPQIQLVLLMPFPGYTDKWPEEEKRRLEKLKNQSIFKYVSSSYSKGAYFLRNRTMVDGSDTCICYLTQKGHSGTGYTVNYALQQGLWIANVGKDQLY